MSKNIMILAGEASGDLQGAYLAGAIKKLNSSYNLTGIGGFRMRKAGVRVLHDSSAWGIIGPWHAIKKIPFLLNLIKQMKKTIIEMKPELLILIDTPSINMRLAKFAKHHGIRTLYFFPPSAWYPNIERARKIAESVHYIVPVFSYSVRTYKKAGVSVDYFGHPLIDMLDARVDRDDIHQKLGLNGDREYVGIFPGSREQEITSLMPVLVKTINKLRQQRPGVGFILPVATPTLRPLIMRYLKDAGDEIIIVDGSSYEVMKISRLIIMACGSASLEAAIFGTPMIILYKLAWPDWCIAKMFIKVPYISLPNLILQREVVPELLQVEANPHRIVETAREIMDDTPVRRKMIEDFQEVRKDLGDAGVVERIGSFVIDLCENKVSITS